MNKGSSPLESESQTLQYIYAALGHAVRYDIIKYLGAFHRPINYTELVEWLQIKPGSFYFHMKKLKHLVVQDEEKRFLLTSVGNLALDVIRSGEQMRSELHSPTTELTEVVDKPPKRFSIFFFGELIRKMTFDTKFQVVTFFILIGQIYLLNQSKLGMIPFFLDGNLYFGELGCVFQVMVSILVVWIILELIIRFYSPIQGFSRELLTGIPLTMVPLFLYPLFVILAENFQFFTVFLSSQTVSIFILFILQLISGVILVQLLQVIKSVNFERALVPVFIILYGFSIVSFLISTQFPF